MHPSASRTAVPWEGLPGFQGQAGPSVLSTTWTSVPRQRNSISRPCFLLSRQLLRKKGWGERRKAQGKIGNKKGVREGRREHIGSRSMESLEVKEKNTKWGCVWLKSKKLVSNVARN